MSKKPDYSAMYANLGSGLAAYTVSNLTKVVSDVIVILKNTKK